MEVSSTHKLARTALITLLVGSATGLGVAYNLDKRYWVYIVVIAIHLALTLVLHIFIKQARGRSFWHRGAILEGLRLRAAGRAACGAESNSPEAVCLPPIAPWLLQTPCQQHCLWTARLGNPFQSTPPEQSKNASRKPFVTPLIPRPPSPTTPPPCSPMSPPSPSSSTPGSAPRCPQAPGPRWGRAGARAHARGAAQRCRRRGAAGPTSPARRASPAACGAAGGVFGRVPANQPPPPKKPALPRALNPQPTSPYPNPSVLLTNRPPLPTENKHRAQYAIFLAIMCAVYFLYSCASSLALEEHSALRRGVSKTSAIPPEDLVRVVSESTSRRDLVELDPDGGVEPIERGPSSLTGRRPSATAAARRGASATEGHPDALKGAKAVELV